MAKIINEIKYLTAAEFADAVGISKQAVYKQLNNQLNEQLNEQLKGKDAQIAQLQKLLDQEQQLNLVANKRVLELENRTRALEDHNKELEIQSNKNWIHKLLGK